jgi:hypothetical protein
MRIDQAGKPMPNAAASRSTRRAQSGFALPESAETVADEAPEAAAPPSAVPSVLLAGIEAPGPAPADDAAAARHGGAMLKAMADLQRAMLEGAGDDACRTLAKLAQTMPSAADPALNEVLQSVAVRAAVELARST